MNSTHCKLISKSKAAGAFTFVELLVVIATLGVLAMMLLPALAKTGPNTQAFQCLNNLRQIQHGWLVYSADNNDRLVPCVGQGPYQVTLLPNPITNPGNPGNQWIYGDVTIASAGANVDLLKLGLIFPYIPTVTVFKCPADPKTVYGQSPYSPPPPGATNPPTVRSISMNGYLNPITNPANATTPPAPLSGAYRLFRKQSDLAVMGSANCFVFIDENPYSINDGWFCTDPSRWVDKPATYHNNCSGLSFADGHAEIHKWRDPALLNYRGGASTATSDGGTDANWLMSKASILK